MTSTTKNNDSSKTQNYFEKHNIFYCKQLTLITYIHYIYSNVFRKYIYKNCSYTKDYFVYQVVEILYMTNLILSLLGFCNQIDINIISMYSIASLFLYFYVGCKQTKNVKLSDQVITVEGRRSWLLKNQYHSPVKDKEDPTYCVCLVLSGLFRTKKTGIYTSQDQTHWYPWSKYSQFLSDTVCRK